MKRAQAEEAVAKKAQEELETQNEGLKISWQTRQGGRVHEGELTHPAELEARRRANLERSYYRNPKQIINRGENRQNPGFKQKCGPFK